ncbi:MAG: outer membrane lipoprotein-sorting protein [Crocinitomicaceae bacterium]|jgi:outer membrane lipoprotein-sorting protein
MKIIALIFTLVTFASFGQDAKAQGIIDKLSKKINSEKSFYLEFTANTTNSDTGTDITITGKGWVKADKYYASLGDNTVISNGLKTWTVVKEEKTTYVADADDEDEESMNPKKLMTLWETGFKSKYFKEETLNGEKVHKIYLYPLKPASVDYTQLVLYISVQSNEMVRVIMKMKDQTKMTYTVKKYTSNPEISDSKFLYDKAKYPGYKLIEG